ncbi:apolipoprotein D-like [Panonychus citri]|uniref:apolipoprotein D-like n=1 Tax=Panonychus citri TaxID=50023 RepID=UPI0023073F03|nr:apolipoprotein D-like [Panonychus citri]
MKMISSINQLIAFTFLLIAIEMVSGQRPNPGGCPKVTSGLMSSTSSKFDLSKYVGVWYELERTANIFEMGMKCVTANYTAKSDGTVAVVNRGISKWGQKINLEGSARVPDSSIPNNLRVTFKFSPEAPYWIADTDYNNYAIVISCADVFGLVRFESIWVLGRTTQLPDSTISSIHSQIERLGFNPSALSKVDQSCPK